MEKVVFDSVKYSYSEDNSSAVENLSFKVEKGEFITILGHNGSGKSTSAKLINALLIPQEGKVLVDGFSSLDENSIIDIRQRCGMVFQNPDNQIIASIVEDDVAFGPENLGVQSEEIRKRVDESLKAVGMYEFMERPPYQLSGGQKQRVAIAGVLAMNASCIIFDEPTAMLDPVGRRDVINIIKELHKKGITIILITHHTEDALLADRVFVMKNGKIALSGKPLEVFSNKDLIESLSLELPENIKLVQALNDRGIKIETESFDYRELVDKICQYMQEI